MQTAAGTAAPQADRIASRSTIHTQPLCQTIAEISPLRSSVPPVEMTDYWRWQIPSIPNSDFVRTQPTLPDSGPLRQTYESILSL